MKFGGFLLLCFYVNYMNYLIITVVIIIIGILYRPYWFVTLKFKLFNLVFVNVFKQNVIDGDLCEQFNSMDTSKQRSVADELDRNPSEVLGLRLLSSQPPLLI